MSVHLDSVASTQDEARARLGDVPVLVTAVRQTRGRGRTGNPWWSAPRALYASLGVRPDWPREAFSRLSLVAGLAMSELLPASVGLKWPNDLVDTATWDKVGGILAEAGGGDVVFGVGLNMWWPDPPAGVGSIHGSDPGAGHAAGIAARWAEALLRRIEAGPTNWGRDEYSRSCVTIGADITWEPHGRGTAVAVATDGALVVETATGAQRLTSSHVHHVRPSYADRPSPERPSPEQHSRDEA